MSKHQRAVLQARKAMGVTPSPQPQDQPRQNGYAQQPPQPQVGQNMYPPQPPEVPPAQNIYTTPASPPRRAEQEAYIPPPGPPPGAMGALRTNNYAARANNNAYSFPPPIPARSRPISHDHAAPTRTLDYGVAENPFADTHPEQQQPQQKSYSLFDRPSQTTPPPPPPPLPEESTQDTEQPQATASTQDPAQESHEPYNPGHRSTPSYINRQESAANSLTMHGAGPPLEQGQTERRARSPVNLVEQTRDQTERRGRTPVSLVEQTRDVQKLMGNMRAWM
jgi:hypothetical protein